MRRPILAWALLLGAPPGTATADLCRVLSSDQAEVAVAAISEAGALARFCEACGDGEPTRLRVRSVATVPWGEDGVEVAGRRYTEAELTAARERREGPAEALLQELSGGDEEARLGWIETLEESLRHRMVEVAVNGEAIDLAYTYLRVSPGRWSSLGLAAGCEGERDELRWSPPGRDPELEAPPPSELVQEILDRTYDGSSFARSWTAAEALELRRGPEPRESVVGTLAPGERVEVLRVITAVEPVRVEVIYDHGPFQEGDVLYLLDGLGEGFYRIWHYGRLLEQEASGVDAPAGEGDPGCPEPSPSCWGRAERAPAEHWWALVRGAAGAEGWVADPERRFAGVMAGH